MCRQEHQQSETKTHYHWKTRIKSPQNGCSTRKRLIQNANRRATPPVSFIHIRNSINIEVDGKTSNTEVQDTWTFFDITAVS
jgi:hypothetical protein